MRERINEGQDLVDFALEVFNGEDIDGHKPNTAMRMMPLLGSLTGVSAGPCRVGAGEPAHNPFDDWSTDDLRALLDAYRAMRDAEAGVIEGEARAIE